MAMAGAGGVEESGEFVEERRIDGTVDDNLQDYANNLQESKWFGSIS